jgi:hypothetical protein
MSIHKLLDEATRINGTGNVKTALTKIIEVIRKLASDQPKEAVHTVNHAPPPAPDSHVRQRSFLVDIPKDIESIKKNFSQKRVSKPVTITKNGEPRKKPGPKPKSKEL